MSLSSSPPPTPTPTLPDLGCTTRPQTRSTPRRDRSPVSRRDRSPVSHRDCSPVSRRTRSNRRPPSPVPGPSQPSSSNVYLLNRRAHGQAGARLPENQHRFMNLMGLTDDRFPTEADGMDWPCPVSSEEVDVFVNASSHLFFQELFKEGVADGFIQKDKLAEAIGRAVQGDYEQCDCAAHRKLLDSTLPESDVEDLKQLIRTPPTLSQATGNMFAVALLRQLFKSMGLPTFRPRATGSVGSVSYVLLHRNNEYSFRGVPDYVVHKDLFGAGHILVATGEVQSTNRPDVQNSIYGVGSLLTNLELCHKTGAIVCVTLFKKKNATLSIARLTPAVGTGIPDVVGSVSLKYVVSPAPMDLDTVGGLKQFATRLHYSFAHAL